MSGKDYKAITASISKSLGDLRQEMPGVMAAFSGLAEAATQAGALDKKTKELVALALAVAARCDGCIGFHTQALAKLGASKAEVNEVLGMAIYMGGGPSVMYAADAMAAFNEASS